MRTLVSYELVLCRKYEQGLIGLTSEKLYRRDSPLSLSKFLFVCSFWGRSGRHKMYY